MLSSPDNEAMNADQPHQVVPDPYPIDDDDMVLVNELEDPLLNGASSKNPPKEKIVSKSKSKREVRKTSDPIFPSLSRPSWEPEFTREVQADGKVSYKQPKSTKPRARTLSNDEDVVMVEAGPSGGEPFVTSGPDDMAFVEHSAPELKRSNTTSKKAGGFFSGFFGGGGGGKVDKTPEPAVRSRPASSYKDDRMLDAEPLPTRTKDKSKRRSVKPYHNEPDALDQGDLDLEAEAQARRAERRSARETEEAARAERHKLRRETDKADLEARRSKARDRARREREAEEQRREEKHARRAAKEDARLKAEADAEAATALRREERKRLRAVLEAEELEKEARIAAAGIDDADKIRIAAKDDRKRQFQREEEDRLRRREEKQAGKPARDKDRTGKRKSTNSPLMDEYFDSRNGVPKQPGGPPDKTSSWVKSQTSDPPDLPPVEGTILDGEKPRSVSPDDEPGDLGGGEEKRRRSSKKEPSSRRHSRYTASRDVDPEMMVDERRASRRKESRRSAAVAVERDEAGGGGIRSGSGSAGDAAENVRPSKHRSSRRREPAGGGGGYPDEYDAYADGAPAAVRTFDGRPANPKRNSILGRFGGMF